MREVFITALLMAEPFETTVDLPQLRIRSLDTTGWLIPAGRYGLVEAAGVGILRRAGVSDEPGLSALERLGEPELSSRSQDFDGRRLVRIDGGFLVLNFQKYRDRDYTSAQRSARYRQRVIEQRSKPQPVRASRRRVTAERRDITQAEAYTEEDLSKRDLASTSSVLLPVTRANSTQDRAARLLQELYPAWYCKHRHGAKLRLVANSLAFQDALSLVELWDDARLEKLATVFLTTDDEWISSTDRSFRVFASRASWCDNRLKQVEAGAA